MKNSEYPPSTGPLKAPTKLNTLKELRAPFEWLMAWGNRRTLKQLTKGRGQPVVLVPGYGAGHGSMRPLKNFLKQLNYSVYDWGHGRNRGHIDSDTARLAETVSSISERHHNEPVALVGWSLGGVLSREVARLYPDLVSTIVTLGTPLMGGPKYTVLGKKYARNMALDLDQYEAEVHAINQQGIQQPLTVLYSKTDGVVGWRASIDHYNQQAKNIAIKGSHLGMVVSAEAWKIIADALSKPHNKANTEAVDAF